MQSATPPQLSAQPNDPRPLDHRTHSTRIILQRALPTPALLVNDDGHPAHHGRLRHVRSSARRQLLAAQRAAAPEAPSRCGSRSHLDRRQPRCGHRRARRRLHPTAQRQCGRRGGRPGGQQPADALRRHTHIRHRTARHVHRSAATATVQAAGMCQWERAGGGGDRLRDGADRPARQRHRADRRAPRQVPHGGAHTRLRPTRHSASPREHVE